MLQRADRAGAAAHPAFFHEKNPQRAVGYGADCQPGGPRRRGGAGLFQPAARGGFSRYSGHLRAAAHGPGGPLPLGQRVLGADARRQPELDP